MKINLIPLSKAVLCVSCHVISDTPGSSCPACGDIGCLLSLSNTLLGGKAYGRDRKEMDGTGNTELDRAS